MPTSTEKFSRGYEGGKNPARSKVRPAAKKTVATVHPDGTVTAKGPEAAAAKKEAETSVKRVKKAVRETKTEEHNRAVAKKLSPSNSRASRIVKKTARELKVPTQKAQPYHESEGLSPSDFLEAAKSVIKDAQTLESGGGKIAREAVEEEAANLAKVAKKNLNPSKLPEPAHAPSADELQAFATIAGTGVTAGEGGALTEKAAAKAVQGASDATTAAKNLPKAVVTKIREAPASGLKAVKEAPQKARELPSKVEHAVTTPEGRKAAAKGAAKTSIRHPIRTGVPAAAIVPPGVIPGDASERARALLTGLAHAVQHPGDMATATGHAVLGAFTAPLAITASAIESAKKGNTEPLEEELGALAQGTLELGKKLISGNPKEVEQTFRHELGYVPLFPAPHIAKSVRNSDVVTSALGDLRGKVESKRAVKRDRLIEEAKAAHEEGAFVSGKHAKKIKMPVEDTKTGQPYINRPLGKFIEHQRGRHAVSRIVSRIEQSGNHSAKAASQPIIKGLRESKLATRSEMNIGDAQRLFNKYGLPLNKEGGEAFVRMLHKNWPKSEHGAIPDGAIVDRHATKWLLDHPEAFSDPHLSKAVELFDKQAQEVGTSPVNQHRAVVENIINPLLEAEGKHRILSPEEMVPKETVDLMGTLVKGPLKEPWSRKTVLDYARDLRVSELEQHFKGKDNAPDLAKMDGPTIKRLIQTQGLNASKANDLALRIEHTLVDGEGNKLMRPVEHGGPEHGVSTTQSTRWTPEMQQAFVDAARRQEKARGLREPAAYVADRLPNPIEEKAPNFRSQIPVPKEWASQGKAAKSGNALADFENLMQHSVEGPRHRAAMVKGLTTLVDVATRKIEGKTAFTDQVAKKLINQHKVPDDTIWTRAGLLKAAVEKGATPEEIRALIEGEADNAARLANGEPLAPISELPISDQLKADLAELKHLHGEKLVPVDGSYMKEFLAHMKPLGGLDTFLGNSTRFASRMILNSPAFEAIQFAQEGIPAAAALARNVVHLPEAYKAMKQAAKEVEDGKLTPQDIADWKAVAGSSAGLYGTPSRAALNANGYLDPVRLAAKSSVWKKAWNLVNGNYLGEFDRNRAGVMRELGLSAKEIGDFKAASKGFAAWRKSANNLYKDMGKAVEDMKGMDVNERHAYMAHHPELEDRFQQAADGLMGNWNSFTVFEKHISPLTLFYTFQRYSALWFLFHFPLDHPIAATALSMLGVVNAKELDKIAKKYGGTPTILDYTKPVYSEGEGKKGVGVYGSRTFPGLSTVGQAAISGKPSQLVGMAPPYLAIPAEAALGKSAYTGQELGENGWAYIGRSVAELNPAMRLFLGLTGEESAAAKAFHAQDPLAKWRSFADPYIGQSAEQFGKTKKLEKDFAGKYGKGNIPSAFDNKMVQELLYGDEGRPKPEMLQEVLDAIHESEGASNAVKEAEAPFNGPESEFSPLQKELLAAVENAWQTGPNAEGSKTSSNPFSQAVQGHSSASSSNPFSEAVAGQRAASSSGNPFSEALAK